jgi:hypothetical protein
MPATITRNADCTLALTQEEREQLMNLLEQALRDKEIEVHRTEAINYREHVQHQEDVLEDLLDKLRRA